MINKTFQQFLPMVEKVYSTSAFIFQLLIILMLQSRLSGSGYSFLDPDSIDLLAYPDMANVQWTYTTLYPADCIYIPAGSVISTYHTTIMSFLI